MPAELKALVLGACEAAGTRHRAQGHVPPPRGGDGASSQATALSLHYKEISQGIKDQRELADLRQRRQPKARRILADDLEKQKKLWIEMGVGRDGVQREPLEPWTCPVNGGKALYQRIVLADDGAYSIGDFTGWQITALHWMGEVQLISADEDGRLHALSDAEHSGGRAYPGAVCNDKKASVGRYLRSFARGLVLAALFRLSAARKRRKAKLVGEDGIQVTAAVVCAEANRIKRKRADLAEYRYLSVTRCQEIIRDLVESGVLDQIAPPKAVRQDRSWRTLPRILRRITGEAAVLLGIASPPESHKAAA